jgi:hypothetical protein
MVVTVNLCAFAVGTIGQNKEERVIKEPETALTEASTHSPT